MSAPALAQSADPIDSRLVAKHPIVYITDVKAARGRLRAIELPRIKGGKPFDIKPAGMLALDVARIDYIPNGATEFPEGDAQEDARAVLARFDHPLAGLGGAIE